MQTKLMEIHETYALLMIIFFLIPLKVNYWYFIRNTAMSYFDSDFTKKAIDWTEV